MGSDEIYSRGSHLVNAAISLPLHWLIGDLHLRPNSIFTAVYRGPRGPLGSQRGHLI